MTKQEILDVLYDLDMIESRPVIEDAKTGQRFVMPNFDAAELLRESSPNFIMDTELIIKL